MDLKLVIKENNRKEITHDKSLEIYNRFMSLSEANGKIYLYEVAFSHGYTYNELIALLLENNKTRAKTTQNKFNQKLNSTKGYNIPAILNNNEFLNNIKNKYNEGTYDFINYLYPLISLDEKDAIKEIEKSKISREKYYTYLNQFINCYPNKVNLLLYLKRLFDNSNIYVPRTTFSKDELIDDYVKSGLCCEEYCSVHGLCLNEFNSAIRYINIPNLDEESIAKSKERITKKFEEICKKIILDEYDIVDYFMDTKLPVQSFYHIVIKYEIANSKMAKEKLNRFNKKCNSILCQKIKKEFELNSMVKLNGIEVDIKTKEKVFKYIEDNELPTSLYLSILKKYINGNLDLDEKVIKL